MKLGNERRAQLEEGEASPEVLAKNGGKPFAKQVFGSTPFDLAKQRYSIQCLSTLRSSFQLANICFL